MSARSIPLSAVILLITVAGLVASGGAGSQALASHTLLGTVTDPGGRPLQGATVELSLPATTGSVRTLTTGIDGTYRFERVVPGLYVLTVRLSGFGPAIRELEIGDGPGEFRFDVRLEVSRPQNGVTTPAPAGPDRRVVCGLTTPSIARWSRPIRSCAISRRNRSRRPISIQRSSCLVLVRRSRCPSATERSRLRGRRHPRPSRPPSPPCGSCSRPSAGIRRQLQDAEPIVNRDS